MSTVSALVSVYNGERFIHGRLNDLLGQTLYAQGRLEIVVIDAGSTDSTQAICREYLDKITYIRSLREPMYSSLNRGIRIATGDYLTTSNVDDRLKPDALEQMAAELDENATVGVVYADNYVTPTANAVWGQPYTLNHEPPYDNGRLNWPEYDRKLLRQFCYIGNQPLWRKDLHDTVGLFDESYLVAGDYELWLRMAAQGVTMKRMPEPLGLFYWNVSQQGRAFAEQSGMESRRALLQWSKYLG